MVSESGEHLAKVINVDLSAFRENKGHISHVKFGGNWNHGTRI